MDTVEATVVAGEATAMPERAGGAIPALCPSVTELLGASDLTPYQRAITAADRAVATAVTESDGDSWWEHMVPDAARAISLSAHDALRHGATLVVADVVGSVAAGAAGAASGAAGASVHDTATCVALTHCGSLAAAAAGRDNCADADMSSDGARQETVVLSDADTEVLDASDDDSQAAVAYSSPDDAAAVCERGGSLLDTGAGVPGVATFRTLRAAGRLRLPGGVVDGA